MSFDARIFGKNYRSFLILASWLSRLPLPMAYLLIEAAGKHFGPLRWMKDSFRAGFEAGAGAGKDFEKIWQKKVSDHSVSCINLFCHHKWDSEWLLKHVSLDLDGLKKIAPPGKGCLLLTYHHAYHHSMFCMLGLSGYQPQVLAAPEDSSFIHEEIGDFIRLQHNNCAKQFNGGKYLFFNDFRQALHMSEDALLKGSLLVSLNDFPVKTTKKKHEVCRIMGRTIIPPNGSIRIAQKLGVPIVVGAFIRDGFKYRFEYTRLDEKLPHNEVLQSYFDYLAKLVSSRYDFWDGWMWFSSLEEL